MYKLICIFVELIYIEKLSMIQEHSQRITRNTLILYFRMIFTMLVSLYTSRVVLNTLGVEDFGIYNVVGGVVAMLSFINGSLSQLPHDILLMNSDRNPRKSKKDF